MEPNKWYDLKYTNATIYTELIIPNLSKLIGNSC